MFSNRARIVTVAAAVGVFLAAGCGGGRGGGDWPLPNARSRRDACSGRLEDRRGQRLEPARALALSRSAHGASYSGIFASTPIVSGDDRLRPGPAQQRLRARPRDGEAALGAPLRRSATTARTGSRVGDGRVYGATDSDAFALDAKTGRELWRRHLTSATEQFVDVAPVFWDGLVFIEHGRLPAGRPRRALRARREDGRRALEVRHDQGAVAPSAEAGGGGALVPGLGRRRRAPVRRQLRTQGPGAVRRSCRTAARSPAARSTPTRSLVLDARSGRLLWHDQVTPHDVRDYDFQATPVLRVGATASSARGRAGA